MSPIYKAAVFETHCSTVAPSVHQIQILVNINLCSTSVHALSYLLKQETEKSVKSLIWSILSSVIKQMISI